MTDKWCDVYVTDSEEAGPEGSKREYFTAYGSTPEERRAMAEALGKAIETAGPDFGQSVKELVAAVAEAEPISVMGAMAMYLGSAQAGTNPEHERPLGVFQH